MYKALEWWLAVKSEKSVVSVASYKELLYCALENGKIATYESPNYQLISTIPKPALQVGPDTKAFACAQPVRQLAVIHDRGILVCLSKTLICLFDLNTCEQLGQIPLGANWQPSKLAVGRMENRPGASKHYRSPNEMLVFATADKQTIGTFVWMSRPMPECEVSIRVPEEIVRMSFFRQQFLIVATRTGYYWLSAASAAASPASFLTFTQPFTPPTMNTLWDQRLLLGNGKTSVLLESISCERGVQVNTTASFHWTDVPLIVDTCEPFVIGLLASKVIEVLCCDGANVQLCQQIDIGSVELDARRLCSASDGRVVYWASQKRVWRIEPTPILQQITCLQIAQKLPLALTVLRSSLGLASGVSHTDQLASMPNAPGQSIAASWSVEDQADVLSQYRQILRSQSIRFFNSKEYDKAFTLFTELGDEVDEHDVVRLFDVMKPLKDTGTWAPSALVETQNSTSSVISITNEGQDDGAKTENGFTQLRDYLLHRRQHYLIHKIHDSNEQQQMRPILNSINIWLLKCFVLCNDGLAELTLKTYGKDIDMDECEQFLIKFQRHELLIALYEQRGRHDKAMYLLWLAGDVDRLIDYIKCIPMEYCAQTSGLTPADNATLLANPYRSLPDQCSEVLSFAQKVFAKAPARTLTIFTDPNSCLRHIHPLQVLRFLQERSITDALCYAQYVVNATLDNTALCHNAIGCLHIKQTLTQLQRPDNNIDSECCRTALRLFLLTSKHYDRQLIAELPSDSLLEERCLALGRLDEHDRALKILLYVIGSFSLAVAYCDTFYNDPHTPSNQYHRLIGLLFDWLPLDDEYLQLTLPDSFTVKPYADGVQLAVELVKQYEQRVNMIEAIPVLAKHGVRLTELSECLQRQLVAAKLRGGHESTENSLLDVLAQQVLVQHVQLLKRPPLLVNRGCICVKCGKPILMTIFRQMSFDGVTDRSLLVHLACQVKSR